MKTVITVSDEIIVALGSTKRSKEEEEEEKIFHTVTHTHIKYEEKKTSKQK